MGTKINQASVTSMKELALPGVARLLDDLQQLIDDRETADVIFLIGPSESPIYSHKLILWTRCKGFQNLKREFWNKTSTNSSSPITFRYPQFQLEVFQQVLHYIYQGKINLDEEKIFEFLYIAQELGLDQLQANCEEIITASINTQKACQFLDAAIEIQSRTAAGSKTCTTLLGDRCAAFIEENATECLKTDAFLKLRKDAVIKLVSSDQLSLEEEEVWRAVLRWGKYQAGVSKPPSRWSEDERNRVKQNLTGVINHIKLLLIDSQVFAEEVEPTGAVPIELSLERYRHAAVPTKTSQSTEGRLQPRTSLKSFQSSLILNKENSKYQQILSHWYGDLNLSWKLLFRGSRDGYSAQAFHNVCDGHSPTFVIIKGNNGDICGGFSDVPWAKLVPRGRYVTSEKAFLFSLVNRQGTSPTKFNIVKKMYAINHHPDFGPVFGAGADLCITSDCNINNESYSNLPHSYNGENASSTLLMGDYNFIVVDYEVFMLFED